VPRCPSTGISTGPCSDPRPAWSTRIADGDGEEKEESQAGCDFFDLFFSGGAVGKQRTAKSAAWKAGKSEGLGFLEGATAEKESDMMGEALVEEFCFFEF